jgi:Transglutaminase-like superfamily
MHTCFNQRLLRTLLGLSLAFSAISGSPSFAQDSRTKATAKEETWQVIYLAGQRIGYSRSTVETVGTGSSAIVKTTSDTFMTIKRFGQTLVMKQALTTEETPAGDLRRFRFEMANPPAMSSVTSGIVEGQELSLTQEVNGKPKTTKQPWKEGVMSPVFQDRMLRENPLKPGEVRTFETFSPEYAKVGKTTLKAFGREEARLLDGKSAKLFKVSASSSLLPGFSMETFLDEHGEAIKVSSTLLGSSMEIYVVSQAEALKAIEGAELDLAIGTLIKVTPMVKAHESKRVVYRVSIIGQDPTDVIPAGDTQTLKKIDVESAELTVVSIPVPRPAKVGNVADEYLESSQYLQRDDDLIQKHANRAAGEATDPGEIARRMETYVRDKLTKKNFSTAMASAAEVARNLEGDCTEHAVLLAAMLRAKGIPSRIVVGLVYADRLFAFGGHMWTEANLSEQWIPLDATLGNGGIGAAHIKLADSALSDDGPAALSGFAPLMNVIGKLKLEVISVD